MKEIHKFSTLSHYIVETLPTGQACSVPANSMILIPANGGGMSAYGGLPAKNQTPVLLRSLFTEILFLINQLRYRTV